MIVQSDSSWEECRCGSGNSLCLGAGSHCIGASLSFFTRSKGAAHWLLGGQTIPYCTMWLNQALAICWERADGEWIGGEAVNNDVVPDIMARAGGLVDWRGQSQEFT